MRCLGSRLGRGTWNDGNWNDVRLLPLARHYASEDRQQEEVLDDVDELESGCLEDARWHFVWTGRFLAVEPLKFVQDRHVVKVGEVLEAVGDSWWWVGACGGRVTGFTGYWWSC